jgi:thioredoxin reductase (NADPH)
MDGPRPLILVADPDAKVAVKVKEFLTSAYGDDFDIMETNAQERAIRILSQARSGKRSVAMLVACVDFERLINQAPRLDPMVRIIASSGKENRERALEAAATDRVHDATMAGNPFDLDLGPTSKALLDEWKSVCDPRKQGVIVIGRSWSNRTFKTEQFLDLWKVPYAIFDPDSREAQPFLDALEGTSGPLVVRPGEWTMLRPDHRKLALALGLTHAPKRPTYDVAIIGGGPGGLAMATLLGSEGLATMVLEADVPGGQASRSSKIWNYPGYPEGTPGRELMSKSLEHARKTRAEIIAPYRVLGIEEEDGFKRIKLEDGQEIFARGVVIATGVEWRKLAATNADNLVGSGVYYGASVGSLPPIAGKEVVVVGGANSAGQAALKMAETASTVHLMIRGDSLYKSMSAYLIDSIHAKKNIVVHVNSEVTAAVGSTRLEAVIVKDRVSQEQQQIATNHLLAYIGAQPNTHWLSKTVSLGERGYVLTGDLLEQASPGATDWATPNRQFATSARNVWAIGDVREGATRRVLGAMGDAGSLASTVHATLLPAHDAAEPKKPSTDQMEVVRLKLVATNTDGARDQIFNSLFSDGYKLDPIPGKRDAWRLCQELDEDGLVLSHIANVSLAVSRRQGKTYFSMRLEVPRKCLVGNAQQRRQQALAWARGVSSVVAERAALEAQQKPHGPATTKEAARQVS